MLARPDLGAELEVVEAQLFGELTPQTRFGVLRFVDAASGRRPPDLPVGVAKLDEDAFYATFYCVSVTRCYPGRHPSGRGDRPATPPEQDLCAFWLDWELRLLRPSLLLVVGGLAARRLLGLTRLTDCIGGRYELGGAVAVPLPHPSGASGWLNDPANRERLASALALVRDELRS